MKGETPHVTMYCSKSTKVLTSFFRWQNLRLQRITRSKFGQGKPQAQTRSATGGAYTVAAAPVGREGTFWHPHRGCRGRHFQVRTKCQILNAWHSTLPKTTPARKSKLYSLALSSPQNSILTQYFFLPTSKPDDFSICLLREKKNRKHGELFFFFRGLHFPFEKKGTMKKKIKANKALSA